MTKMKLKFATYFTSIALMICAFASHAQSVGTGPHIEVELVSEMTALVPGQTQYLAIWMKPETEWHTYWRNPGDSGEAPKIEWTSDAGLTFGKIQWPLPHAIPVAHLVNYGYDGSHLLMVPVDIPADLAINQAVNIEADLSWLVCKEDCIPGWATLNTQLVVNKDAVASSHADRFVKTRANLPKANLLTAQYEINQAHIAIKFAPPYASDWQIFPFRSDLIQHAADISKTATDDELLALLPLSSYFNGAKGNLQFLIHDDKSGYYVEAVEANLSEHVDAANNIGIATALKYALMALLGGIILNIMPCVLPILSMKALALQHAKPKSNAHFAYVAGVLTCFNVFAIILIGLQSSGEQLGWGFHMQSPVVLSLLAFLFAFISLALLDAFQVGTRLSGLGNDLISGQNAQSHFFTGLLAVIVASPCTAPFMAAALGVALVSQPIVTLLIFNGLAIGFALPLTAIHAWSGFSSMLPKPGAWMVTFKHILAFPMIATSIWLCWVFANVAGSVGQLILMLSVVTFALCAWLASRLKGIATNILMLGMIASIAVPISFGVRGSKTQRVNESASAIPFSENELQRLRNENQVVLVNMTADWCITCKVNEAVALSTDEVQAKLGEADISYMVGDWTNKNEFILDYLREYERAGVPLYVVYAGNDKEWVLPQILTPSSVIEALNIAQKEKNYVD